MRFEWFGDPVEESLLGIPAHREKLGLLLRALLDQQERADGKDEPFAAATDLVWVPFQFAQGQVGVGLVWNSDKDAPLGLGVGAKAAFSVSNKQVALAVLARLVSINNELAAGAGVGDLFDSALGVELREPHVGVRYGVEPKNPLDPGLGYRVNLRTPAGQPLDGKFVNVHLAAGTRVLKVDELLAGIRANLSLTQESPWKGEIKGGPAEGGNVPESAARAVATHLEQNPYVQVFQRTVDEEQGYALAGEVMLAGRGVLNMRHGRRVKLDKYAAPAGRGLEQEER